MAFRDIRTLQAPLSEKIPELRFDEFLNLSLDRQRALAYRLKPLVVRNRKRAPKADAEARLVPLLGCIIANAIVAMDEGPPWGVHYSRNERMYVGRSVYKPDWLLSKQFISTIDAMADSGLLQNQVSPQADPKAYQIKAASWNPELKKLERKPPRSVYRATERLAALLEQLGLSASDAFVDEDAKPVVLLSKAKGQYVEYDPAEVAEESDRLRTLNRFLRQHTVSVVDPQTGRVRSKPFTLHRIYNRGSWSLGGRLYGWWQNVPKIVRETILIDGEPTTELDYGSFFARLIYHLEGLESPLDPYAAPALVHAFEEAGIPWSEGRDVAKTLFQVMLNASGLVGLHRSEPVRRLPPTIDYRDAIKAIQEFNAPIASRFFTGYGLSLMNEESNLCYDVLDRGMRMGVPIIPVHDSFRVIESNSDWLSRNLVSAYQERFNALPVVK